jgi:hypothetical protein
VGATTGPSPEISVFTWVWVTLNGASTVTSGAAISVDPATATLPVAPGSVHSGAVPSFAASVGHGVTVVGGAMTVDVTTSATDGVLVDDASLAAPQPASNRVSAAAPAAKATG